MEHRISHGPTFTTVEFVFSAGEALVMQPGSMIGMSTGFELEAKLGSQMKGGNAMGRSLRSMVSGENFFAAVYRAKRDGERLVMAPNQLGEISVLAVVPDQAILIASGCFLACTTEVELEAKYVGARGFMSTRGLFMMRTTGKGQIFIASHGVAVEQRLAVGERFVLDNHHLVAQSDGLLCETVKVASTVRHSFLSGEGIVNRYTGPGWLMYQTRRSPGLGLIRGVFNLFT